MTALMRMEILYRLKWKMTAKEIDTVVAEKDYFGTIENIEVGDGAQTFVFGNDYWGKALINHGFANFGQDSPAIVQV